MAVPTSDLHGLRTAAIIATLRKSRMFAVLTQEDVAAIAAGCTLRSLEKGGRLGMFVCSCALREIPVIAGLSSAGMAFKLTATLGVGPDACAVFSVSGYGVC